MFVYHFRLRKGMLAAGAAILALTVALSIFLPGCHHEESTPIAAATEDQRQSFLADLGWAVNSAPTETLNLQLPQQWDGEWKEYVALQSDQGLPFADYKGQQVQRYTYAVNNYPGVEKGVQINLYVCGEHLIGGDVISLGENGFQVGLAFPNQSKT